jgi:NAD(P)-dependent dehydrogenase (short-subunit alcohol dehydrogenase family)
VNRISAAASKENSQSLEGQTTNIEALNKVAIVTGAGGGGSGRAIARRLARDGASVVVSDINEEGGRETVRLIEEDRGRSSFCRADIARDDDIRALFSFAETTYGGVDILVNNASSIHQGAPLEHWFETIQVDLLGAMSATLLAIAAMRRRGGGAIVNIGSVSALGHGRRHSPWPAYDTAKAAIIRLTTTLGQLRISDGIRVNCLVPDWVATDEITAAIAMMTPEERIEWRVPEVLITLDEIADAVVELITNESLAGRVMVRWCGQERKLIADGDPGYRAFE